MTYFETTSKLGVRINVTKNYWRKIIEIKHPSMAGKEKEVKVTLEKPNEVRRSKIDSEVHLYYRKHKKNYICVVAKHEGARGFVITTYVTAKIKEGEQIWKK